MMRRPLVLVAALLVGACSGTPQGAGAPPPPPELDAGPAAPPQSQPDAATVADAAIVPADATVSPDVKAEPDAPPALSASTVWRMCGAMAAVVTTLAQSPDGRWLAAGFADGHVSVMSLPAMTVMARFPTGATYGVTNLAFTEDGALLASLSAGTVKLWAVPSGALVRELGSGLPGGTNLQITRGPSPLLLAAGTGVPAVMVWRLDGPMVASLGNGSVAGFTDGARAVAVVDTFSGDQPVAVVTSLEGRMLRRFSLPSFRTGAISPDGAYLAISISEERDHVEVFSLQTGARVWRSSQLTSLTRQLVFLEQPARLLQVTALGDAPVLYDLATGRSLGTLPFTDAFKLDAAADGRTFAGVTSGGTLVRVAADGTVTPGPSSEFGITEPVITFSLSRDGRHLAAAGETHTWILDVRDGSLVRQLPVAGFKPQFSPDGAALAMGGAAPAVYRLSDGRTELTLPLRPPSCTPSLVFSADGQTLASGTCGRVELFRRDGTRLGELPSHAVAAGVAFSPDGKWLATSGAELYPVGATTAAWPATVLPPPDNGPVPVSDDVPVFSPDGKLLLVSRSVSVLGLRNWRTRTDFVQVSDGTVLRSLVDTRISRRPSFSPDGTWVTGGGNVYHFATDKAAGFAISLAVSHFLADNRIAAMGTERVVRLYCPMTPP